MLTVKRGLLRCNTRRGSVSGSRTTRIRVRWIYVRRVRSTFLRDYLRENAAHVTEKSGCADTVARIHVVNRMDPSLTLPREVTFRAYAAGRTAPEDVDLQRALMTAGIPFRTEGKDTSWRYAFYAKGKAPKGQPEKLPCLSMPLAELPLEVQSELVKLFGDRFGNLLPRSGEEDSTEVEVGGVNR